MWRFICLALCFTFIAGCSSHRLYDWGGYDSHLYRYYENPQAAESFRNALESHIGRLESMGRKPPPGLYAELGTLYLERGDTGQAITLYEKEQQAWPESERLMASLISNLSTETNSE